MEPRPRVLIVEDDPGLRTLLRVALGAEFELDETDNGEEALRLITDRRYDAVLLDVVLAAGQRGYTVCHAMRQMPRGRDVKIIFCTAMGGVPGRSRGFEVGADAYVTKPFSPLGRRAQLQELLSETRASESKRRVARESEGNYAGP
jgi:DNA-binding response OmpR family regulator